MQGDIVRGKDFALCKMIQILDVKKQCVKNQMSQLWKLCDLVFVKYPIQFNHHIDR